MDIKLPDRFDGDASWMPEMQINVSAPKDELMKQIMEYDFAALDLQLYLNSHPNDQRALYLFNNCHEMSRKLKDAYEKAYGPITPAGSGNRVPFRWIQGPWPWQG